VVCRHAKRLLYKYAGYTYTSNKIYNVTYVSFDDISNVIVCELIRKNDFLYTYMKIYE